MSVNWNNVKPACCARWLVLPTVYSDALSYGEQLDKFCYQLNQLIENNNILPDFIAEMIKEYINSGAIGEVVRDILADYILNVKYPPEGIKPAMGDGSADDTEAIQGCIDYASANGGVVYFPYGSYLTQPLAMKDGVSLFGFDRYSTKIVLKGGATKPLISGTVAGLSIANLTLDGNSGIQVNDVNVVAVMATDMLMTNLIIKDGYTLVNYYGTGGHFQISDVVFGNAVEKCLVTAGNANVQAENLVFNQLSAVGGISVMDIGTDGGYFNVKSVATCDKCIVVSGNGNNIVAIVENATTPVTDNGLKNNIEIVGVSDNQYFDGDTTKEVNGSYSKHIGGTYTKAVDGNSSESYNGNYSKNVTGVASETYSDNKTVTGKKVVLNATNYNLNATNNYTETVKEHYFNIGERSFLGSKISTLMTILDFGAKDDGSDCSEAIQKSLDAMGVAIIPPGTFKCNVTLNDSDCLFGFGKNSILKPFSENTHLISANGISSAKIYGLHLIGTFTENVDGINLVNSSGILMDDLYVENFQNGINIDGKLGISDKLTHVNNCFLYNNLTCGLFVNNYADICISNTESVSNSFTAFNSGYNMYFINSPFKMVNCHLWNQNDSLGLKRTATSLRALNSHVNITNCHIEGGYTDNVQLDTCSGSIVNSLIYATFGAYSVNLSSSNISIIGCSFTGQAADDVSYKPDFKSIFTFDSGTSVSNKLIGCTFSVKLCDKQCDHWVVDSCTYIGTDLTEELGPTCVCTNIYSSSGIKLINYNTIINTTINVNEGNYFYFVENKTLEGTWYNGARAYIYNASDSTITITVNQPNSQVSQYQVEPHQVLSLMCLYDFVYNV